MHPSLREGWRTKSRSGLPSGAVALLMSSEDARRDVQASRLVAEVEQVP
jgi:hypothetical protein